MGEQKTIFGAEEKLIEKAQAVLNDEQYKNDPLLSQFSALFKGYKRIFKQLRRLIKLSDSQQMKLLEDALSRQIELTNAYSRFVPPEYLEFLHKDTITKVFLGDHVSKEMAVMFSDIRSFTTISETMTPQENFNFVNAYLKRVSPIIRDHQGIIVKYLGDGMMAVFPNGAEDAVSTGLGKLRQVTDYNLKRQQAGRQRIQVGIGIHVGHMMVGMVGEENRMQGDAFSDNVNLTARLEGLTKYYGVSLIISGEAYEKIDPSRYHIRFLDNVAVKGKSRPIAIYEVFDADPDELLELKVQAQANFDEGQRLYFAQEFAEAVKVFINVLNLLPDDITTKLYLERSAKFMIEGVPDDWQGVRTMDKK